MVHSERQFLQSEQNQLQHWGIGGRLRISQPRVQQLVATDTDKSVKQNHFSLGSNCVKTIKVLVLWSCADVYIHTD